MAENKFIKRLHGKETAKSVVEIKNTATPTMFTNMPAGDSNVFNTYSDHRGNATGVLRGTDNWKLSGSSLVSATTVYGDGRDMTGAFVVGNAGLWVDATYTFTESKLFTPNTEWVLKLCGNGLLSDANDTVELTMLIKFGSTMVSKTFFLPERSFSFSEELVIDFSESVAQTIKVNAGDTMVVQVLCGDSSAHAQIYNGMTVLTALQRRVDGDVVASDKKTFDEVVQDIDDINDEIDQIQEDVDDLKDYCDETFLPLTGGTLTGDLAFRYNTSYPVLRIIQSGQNTSHLRFINNNSASQSISFDLSQAAIHPLVTGRGHVGTSNIHFGDAHIDKIYTGFINNGYDISVPVTASADSFALGSEITDINGKIPAQASSSNQLADKSFVNSSIATNTANFIGTFNSVAELEAYSGTVTNNDYAFVIGTDSAGNTTYNRYKYNANTQQWAYEYTLNNSSFTAAQWATINSGGTAADIALARSAVQPADVGNGTITITQGGETKGSFTTNQGGNTTIDIDAGGGGSGLNIGDIFMTMRNDNELNGAVECDGATYNTTDFTGTESIGALLEAGKLDYVSLSAYSTAISTKGWCDKIGWNGTGNIQFRVPTLNAYIWQKLQLGIKGSIGSGSGGTYFVATQSSFTQYTHPDTGGYSVSVSNNQTIPGASVDITSEDFSQQRCMIQLATGATDQALETCTGVLADVADLKDHRVIAFQAPTAGNNYTWYRKYADGWVEQGGICGNGTQTIVLPVEMADTNYKPMLAITMSTDNAPQYSPAVNSTSVSTTGFKATFGGSPNGGSWQVSGMAAS